MPKQFPSTLRVANSEILCLKMLIIQPSCGLTAVFFKLPFYVYVCVFLFLSVIYVHGRNMVENVDNQKE